MPILIPPKDVPGNPAAEAAGKKLVYLSQHAQDAGDPEIVKFRGNPNSYLNDIGYRKWTGVDDGDGKSANTAHSRQHQNHYALRR